MRVITGPAEELRPEDFEVTRGPRGSAKRIDPTKIWSVCKGKKIEELMPEFNSERQ